MSTYEEWIQTRNDIKSKIKSIMLSLPINSAADQSIVRKKYLSLYGEELAIFGYGSFMQDFLMEMSAKTRFENKD